MATIARVTAAAFLCTLAACTNGGDPKESGNMTNGPQAAGGAASVDTAGSAVNTTTVPTGSGIDTAPKPSSSTSGLKADTARKAP